MQYTYNKYYSIDFAIELYMELIRLTKNKRPNIQAPGVLYLHKHPIILSRVLAAAFSTYISRVNELLLDLDNSDIHEELEKTVDAALKECGILDKITPKKPMTNNELKQQIKNALAHAEYTIGHEEEGYICLDITSPKIEGKLNIQELSYLTRAYCEIYNILTPQRLSYQVEKFFTQTTNNKNVLRKNIESITVGPYKSSKKLPSAVTAFGFETEYERPLTKEQQDFIYNYVMYVGIQNWVNLDPDDRMEIFVHVVKPQIEKHLSPFITGSNLADILDYLINDGKGHVSNCEYAKMVYKFPTIYTNFMVELGFLCLNHIKEAQAKETLEDFNYRNINLKGIKYEPKSCVRLVTQEEQILKYNKQLEALKQSAEKEREKLEKKRQEIISLQENKNIPTEKKKEMLERRKQEIEETSIRLNSLTSRIYNYEDLIEISADYIETNDFFKHLRNSISHGFYSVDYSTGLKEKDLGKIVFHFEDWDISKEDRSNRKKVFSLDITGDQLMNIYEQLKDRLIESANTLDQQLDKRIFFRNKCQGSEYDERIKTMHKKLEQRGATIIKTTQKES